MLFATRPVPHNSTAHSARRRIIKPNHSIVTPQRKNPNHAALTKRLQAPSTQTQLPRNKKKTVERADQRKMTHQTYISLRVTSPRAHTPTATIKSAARHPAQPAAPAITNNAHHRAPINSKKTQKSARARRGKECSPPQSALLARIV